MTLKVDPDEIRIFASNLARLSEDAEIARGYAERIGSFDVLDTGAIGLVMGKHRAFMADFSATMQKLATLFDSSAVNMQATASQYQRTDEKGAAEIDASYPASPRPIADVS